MTLAEILVGLGLFFTFSFLFLFHDLQNSKQQHKK